VLSQVVKESIFQDAKNTTRDPCLLGPPSLEFAPYNKTPSGRMRQDGRQGTIDQDQEFIDFLQSLTEPITKAAANGTDFDDEKLEPVAITPLVQYIKEKKANKAKEAAQAKAAKTATKEAKPAKSERPPTVIIKGKAGTPAADKEKEKERVAKTTQDTVKAVQKSVAPVQAKPAVAAGKEAKKQTPAKESPPQPPPVQQTKQERAREPRDNARGAARMLQRDLGFLGKGNPTARTPKASTATYTPAIQGPNPAASGPKQPEATTTQQKPSTPSTPTTPAAPPTGPRASRTPNTATPGSAKQPQNSATQSSLSQAQPQAPQRQAKQQTPSSQPSPGAKSAFLKHANPSQGITEELLREAFKSFGTITRCEIDKKKGLGYVDFTEHDGLKKAMANSPVKVGNGQVVVLENKSPHGKRGGGAASGPNNSTQKTPASSAAGSPALAKVNTASVAAMNSPKLTTTVAAAQATGVPSQTPDTPTAPTPASATTPTAPRSTPRSGNRGGRSNARGGGGGGGGGGQAQNQTQNQSQNSTPNQSGNSGRRGGRGNNRGGGRGGNNAATSQTPSIPAGGAESNALTAPAPSPASTAAVPKDESKTA
jgi:regulator of nonsense transcripts 3